MLLCATLLPLSEVLAQQQEVQNAVPSEITVRVLDYRSGMPLSKIRLLITAGNGDEESWARGRDRGRVTLMNVSEKTDKEGKVIVLLPQPLPEHLRIFSFDLWQGAIGLLVPAEILRSGKIVPYGGGKEISKLQVVQKPGEIIVLNRKLSVWDQMKKEIP
jgi:hypothetical protein